MSRRSSVFPTLIVLLVVVGFAIIRSRSERPAVNHTTSSYNSSQQTNPDTPVAEQPSASCHMKGVLPDPTCTPGVANANVTQANIQQTICVSGYTKTVRPPVNYTDKLKVQQMQEYGFTDNIRLHEEDHLISLELGGSPTDPKNLWPEPGNSPNPKDKVEDFLHTAVCDGRVSLQDAQTRIATDWTNAENGL